MVKVLILACRYGGEELTLILPGATLDAARARALIIVSAGAHGPHSGPYGKAPRP